MKFSQVYAAGQVLNVSRLIYKHTGIVSDRWEHGEQMVLCCSGRKGCVVEERMSEFLGGFLPEPVEVAHDLSNDEVLARARSKLGEPYQAFTWNCEHLVSYALGKVPESPQMRLAVMTAASLFLGGQIASR